MGWTLYANGLESERPYSGLKIAYTDWICFLFLFSFFVFLSFSVPFIIRCVSFQTVCDKDYIYSISPKNNRYITFHVVMLLLLAVDYCYILSLLKEE